VIVTCDPAVTVIVQAVPQSMPLGVDDTLPPPVPLNETVKVTICGGGESKVCGASGDELETLPHDAAARAQSMSRRVLRPILIPPKMISDATFRAG